MDQLCNKWHNLLCKIDREALFDYALFKEAFSEPFKILQPISVQPSIPKEYMELYLVADKFARHFVTGISKEHDAAGELTLEMLWDCGIGCTEDIVESYFDNDIHKNISYTDVDSAICALAEKYAEDYD